MLDLDLDIESLIGSFPHEVDSPFVLVRVPEDEADAWLETLVHGIRRCYADDDFLEARSGERDVSRIEILSSLLPDPGSVMSGDFGEILVFVYQAATEHPEAVIGPKKWRLKQDRSKPAPYSDVVQFIVPAWPEASNEDRILCSEVKTKATNGSSTPISSAIEDCEKDRVGRLAETLVWFRERAMTGDLGTTSVAHLDRFIKATDHPPASKEFRAVAVLCSSVLDKEILSAPGIKSSEYELVVVAVPDLKRRYEALFDAVRQSVSDEDELS